jgi:hypothetical protein
MVGSDLAVSDLAMPAPLSEGLRLSVSGLIELDRRRGDGDDCRPELRRRSPAAAAFSSIVP